MPTNIPRLVVGAALRLAHHIEGSLGDSPEAAAHRQSVKDTRLSFEDPRGNLFQVRRASRYSTDRELKNLAERTPVICLVSEIDEFGSAYRQAVSAFGVKPVRVNAFHDVPLINPRLVAKRIAWTGALPQFEDS